MRARLRSASLRSRLMAAVLLSVAGALAITVLAFNLVLDARLSSDASNLLHARASAELSTLRVVDGRLVAAEAPDDAALDRQVWAFAGARPLERPRAPGIWQLAVYAPPKSCRVRRSQLRTTAFW